MRLLTAGSLVRAQQGEPKEKRYRLVSLFFFVLVWHKFDPAVAQGAENGRRQWREERGRGEKRKGGLQAAALQDDYFSVRTVGSSWAAGAKEYEPPNWWLIFFYSVGLDTRHCG